MKKIGLGIGILLFAILLRLSSAGLETFVVGIGVIGLGFVISGSNQPN
ncbi:MAG: hypothetical protein E7L17_07315 [Clostridium sp.]|nr:hypothetical protein [Clostridium sp.]MDU7337905.1 hypothetical protein [Clostridium sp.]